MNHYESPPPKHEWNPNESSAAPHQPVNPHVLHDTVTPQPAPADASVRDPRYAHLNLSRHEYVIREAKRHIIGVLQIYFVAALAIIGLVAGIGALLAFASEPQQDIISGTSITIPPAAVLGLGGFLMLLTIIITFVAAKVYYGNRLYLTNESVIQIIQTSLFHHKEQQITLTNIEDASYERRGILQHMLNYGTIRLSTEGEETTYYFHYARDPKVEVGHIIQAQEDFNEANTSQHRANERS